MHQTKLRKVGGSVMLAVPPALLDTLAISAGQEVGLQVEGGRLIVAPHPRRRYSLDALLKEEAKARRRKRDRLWLDGAPKGRELV